MTRRLLNCQRLLGMVVTMPFGYSVIVDVTSEAGKPEAAPLLAAAILVVAGGISGAVAEGGVGV